MGVHGQRENHPLYIIIEIAQLTQQRITFEI